MKYSLLFCGCLAASSLFSQGFNQISTNQSTLSQFAVGDYNGDGREDVLGYQIFFSGSSNVKLWLNDGNTPATLVETPLGFDVAVQGRPVAADFDGDDDLDLAITLDTEDAQVAFLINNGNAEFTLDDSRNLPGGGLLESADFDDDGNPDLAAFNDELNTLTHFENNGADWEADVLISGDFNLKFLQLADIDNDGDVDILPGYTSGQNRVSILQNSGFGTFNFENLITEGSFIKNMVVGDFNGDGLPDIYTAYPFASDVRVYLNQGNLQFALESLGVPPASVSSILPADYDGDGLEDISVGTGNAPIVWFKNLGTDPASTERFDVGEVTSAFSQATIDLENDGDLDILVGNGDFWIYENTLEQDPSSTIEFGLPGPKIYPNPAHDQLTVHYSLPYADNRVTITVYDALGRIMTQQTDQSGGKDRQFTLSVDHLTAGNYHLFINSGSDFSTARFSKR
ncbi:hypothetical protein CEQ90_09990 [Lewinellaceae bacterium SD302]|nr:hypothetical protein CEQ90_09990 [Lewinellaceae bacterium SD302]